MDSISNGDFLPKNMLPSMLQARTQNELRTNINFGIRWGIGCVLSTGPFDFSSSQDFAVHQCTNISSFLLRWKQDSSILP